MRFELLIGSEKKFTGRLRDGRKRNGGHDSTDGARFLATGY